VLGKSVKNAQKKSRIFKLRWLGRLLLSLLAALPFVLHTYNIWSWDLLVQVENFLYDLRLRETMPNTVDPRVVIVDVDERSLKAEGQWPWPRDKVAALVRRLFEDYGVRIAGFDMVFAEPETEVLDRVRATAQRLPQAQTPDGQAVLLDILQNAQTDQAFADAITDSGALLLGYVFKTSLQENEPVSVGILPQPVYRAGQLADVADVALPEPMGFVGNLEGLQRAALTGGFFDNPLIDRDGIFRRVPLTQRYQGDLYEALSLALAREYNPGKPLRFQFAEDQGTRDSLGLKALCFSEECVPVDGETGMLVPYRGPVGSFPYVSATDVLNGQVDIETLFDSIVLIGTSAPGLLDLRSTPVGTNYPGVEVHANIISGMLDQRYLHRPAYIAGAETVLLLFTGILLVCFMPHLGAIGDVILVTSTLGAHTAFNFWMWISEGTVLPLASPLLYVLVLYVLQVTYGFFTEGRRKQRLSRVFGQYIPPELAMEISASNEEVSLLGENREMTVMFADVRGFTTLSAELQDPEKITAVINTILTPATEVIHRHRGTLDKYIGDAVMAFWGAPLESTTHAHDAVLSAMEMVEAVNNLADEFKRNQWPPVKIGVGVNTGTMNVGNMGSQFRLAYTVLGDAVNLGARLEPLTKFYTAPVIVSEHTVSQTPEIVYRKLDYVTVAGRSTPLFIYQPVGLEASVSAEQQAELRQYHTALDAYFDQQWDVAEATFTQLHQQQPQPIYKLYLERIVAYQQTPPFAGWMGIHPHGK